jgi:flagellar biosynthesis protein FlhA
MTTKGQFVLNSVSASFRSALTAVRMGYKDPRQWRSLVPGTDVGLAMGVAMLLSVLILPLPTVVLDIGLSLSVTISVLILMVSLFLETPLDFTAFPTLLLLTTLLRLALEVATTRLILSHGNEGIYAAGHVVAAFGGFLMGGDVLIGAIVFSILMVVNFMVITKGSGRIAEVAARFSLDAMPGKQMAIDAELASGAISDKVARQKRRRLEEESSFFGSMDGAAKFVRGDAIAGIIITVINIVGGLTIGIFRHGMSVSDAAASFTTLTIGDGLVSQIPALLVSAAAGIVVTKGGTEGAMDAALVRQLTGGPKPLQLAAGLSFLMAFMPGLPALPFLALGTIAGGIAWYRYRHPMQDQTIEDVVTEAPSGPVEPPLSEVMRIDLLRLELGFNLLSFAGTEEATLTAQIKMLRRTVATEMGFILPPVRIQDNLQLGADHYCMKIREIDVGSGEVRPHKFLVMDPQGGLADIPGERTTEPAFGLPALWVDETQKEQASFRGYTVVDPCSVIVTHLSEVVRENMPDLLSYVQTQKLLDDLPREQQKLVSDLIPSQVSLGIVHRVLQGLLAERVSIRDITTILEALQEAAGLGLRVVPQLIAHVRVRLARQISAAVIGADGFIQMITLSPQWEEILLDSLTGPPEDRQMAMEPTKLNDFVKKLRSVLDQAISNRESPVLVVSPHIRFPLEAVVKRIRSVTPVVAQTEIFPKARIRTIAVLK